MTSAGSGEVAYSLETSFETLAGSPTWKQPFENQNVGSANLVNNLQRVANPGDPRPKGYREGNVEGTFNISGVMTDTNFHELIFPESTNQSLATSASLAPTATWYLKGALPSGTDQERFLSGAFVESVTWRYQQGGYFEVDLQIRYADEPEVGGTHGNAPSAISTPSKGDMVASNGISFSLDGNTISLLQSLEVSISNMARFRRGPERTPVDAVVGPYDPSGTVTAIIQNNNQLQLAYGGTTATTTEDTIDSVNATLTADKGDGATVATYNLTAAQANDYNWSDLVNEEADLTDPTVYRIQDIAVA